MDLRPRKSTQYNVLVLRTASNSPIKHQLTRQDRRTLRIPVVVPMLSRKACDIHVHMICDTDTNNRKKERKEGRKEKEINKRKCYTPLTILSDVGSSHVISNVFAFAQFTPNSRLISCYLIVYLEQGNFR